MDQIKVATIMCGKCLREGIFWAFGAFGNNVMIQYECQWCKRIVTFTQGPDMPDMPKRQVK